MPLWAQIILPIGAAASTASLTVFFFIIAKMDRHIEKTETKVDDRAMQLQDLLSSGLAELRQIIEKIQDDILELFKTTTTHDERIINLRKEVDDAKSRIETMSKEFEHRMSLMAGGK